MIQFETPRCPTCKRHATGTLERLQGVAQLRHSGDGFEYASETDISWDSQETVYDENDLITLTCGDHEWKTRVTSSDDGDLRPSRPRPTYTKEELKLQPWEKANFATLHSAFSDGNAAVMTLIEKSTGLRRLVVCAAMPGKSEVAVTPFAVMIEDDPFKLFEGPSTVRIVTPEERGG